MTETGLHSALVWAVLLLAPLTACLLMVISAPYGRHGRAGWGPTASARWAWLVMESPSVLVFLGVYALGDHRAAPVPLLFLAMWQVHYVHRTFIYPLRMKSTGRRTPFFVALLAFLFTLVNAYINARWVSHLGTYSLEWLANPRFVAGAALFALGMGINLYSDGVLLRLRGPGQSGYKVPEGGLYRWVSCPNYLGEILEWIGWALATWSLAGVAFAAYTAANLVPRARSHHRWYREQFPEYPKERKALVPFVF